jgi:hypothetical protein
LANKNTTKGRQKGELALLLDSNNLLLRLPHFQLLEDFRELCSYHLNPHFQLLEGVREFCSYHLNQSDAYLLELKSYSDFCSLKSNRTFSFVRIQTRMLDIVVLLIS